MKKLFLILMLLVFGVIAVGTTPAGCSVAFAQKREEKKDPPGPPVIKDKGNQDKTKPPPPRKDKKP